MSSTITKINKRQLVTGKRSLVIGEKQMTNDQLSSDQFSPEDFNFIWDEKQSAYTLFDPAQDTYYTLTYDTDNETRVRYYKLYKNFHGCASSEIWEGRIKSNEFAKALFTYLRINYTSPGEVTRGNL